MRTTLLLLVVAAVLPAGECLQDKKGAGLVARQDMAHPPHLCGMGFRNPTNLAPGTRGTSLIRRKDFQHGEQELAAGALMRIKGGGDTSALRRRKGTSKCQFQLSFPEGHSKSNKASVLLFDKKGGFQIFPMRVGRKVCGTQVLVVTAVVPSDPSDVAYQFMLDGDVIEAVGDKGQDPTDQFKLWVPPDGSLIASITLGSTSVSQTQWVHSMTYGSGAADVWIRDPVTYEFEDEAEIACENLAKSIAITPVLEWSIWKILGSLAGLASSIPAAIHGTTSSLRLARQEGRMEAAIAFLCLSMGSGVAWPLVVTSSMLARAVSSSVSLVWTAISSTVGALTFPVAVTCSSLFQGAQQLMLEASSAAAETVGAEFDRLMAPFDRLRTTLGDGIAAQVMALLLTIGSPVVILALGARLDLVDPSSSPAQMLESMTRAVKTSVQEGTKHLLSGHEAQGTLLGGVGSAAMFTVAKLPKESPLHDINTPRLPEGGRGGGVAGRLKNALGRLRSNHGGPDHAAGAARGPRSKVGGLHSKAAAQHVEAAASTEAMEAAQSAQGAIERGLKAAKSLAGRGVGGGSKALKGAVAASDSGLAGVLQKVYGVHGMESGAAAGARMLEEAGVRAAMNSPAGRKGAVEGVVKRVAVFVGNKLLLRSM